MLDMCCADLEIELDLSREVVSQLQKEKEEAELKAEKVTRGLERKDTFVEICRRSIQNMFNMLMPYLQNTDIMCRHSSRCSRIRCRPRRTSLMW